MNEADLIIRGLGSQHLAGFLPGHNNQAAISSARSGALGWTSPGGPYGNVTRDGIGIWDTAEHHSLRKPARAVLFVTWDRVLLVVAAGCGEGRRDEYEAAYRAWAERCRWQDWRPDGRLPYCSTLDGERERLWQEACVPGWYGRATGRLHEATAAIIRAGAVELDTCYLF